MSVTLGLCFILFLFLPLFTNGHQCSQEFLDEARAISITPNCKKKRLGAEFAWSYNDSSRRLDIVFGARLDEKTGWLAWGLNPHGPHMVGTQALIGIKLGNKLSCDKYNITDLTRIGCPLTPVKDLDLKIQNFSFFFQNPTQYYAIKATVFLPEEYNSSRTSIVWQIGYAAAANEPKMHPKTLKNFDSVETIDLNSNYKIITYSAHHIRCIRMTHGILNIVGWGTLLPVGVIIARYFRNFPVRWYLWSSFHINCQIAGYILGSSGWAMGLWLGNQSKYYSFHIHRIFGIIIFTFTTIQIFALRLKPKRSDPFRGYWNMYHHFLGYSLLALISFNIFKGISILKPNDTWKWGYIGILGFLTTTALALEVFTWSKFIKNKISTDSSGRKKKEQPQPQPQQQGLAGTGTSVQPLPT
ncbi:Hypothetical predicted protein [Olea europaea subsp. europaea]|uniref:Cytochrome b561 and DOMON domain-containing protein n=1 Tax=Olea europaea subsp. europaea TaxID=158383 RepID=A0A8S0PTL5_OLEEU|nr:Hypothetical predicted protein [Olea europaea subsp. europaea]